MNRIRSSPVGSRLAKGASWTLGGALLGRVFTLASSIIIARVIGREGFGQFGIIQSTLGMFTAFAGFGLGLTATKYVATLRESDPQRAGRVMALSSLVAAFTGVLGAAILIVGAEWLATRTLAAPHLSDELRVSGIALIFMALNGSQSGALSGFEAFSTITRITTIATLLTIPMMVGGAYWGGVKGCVWGLAAGQLLTWVLFHLALRKTAAAAGVPFILESCWKELPVLHAFSLPALLTNVLIIPVAWACNTMLVNLPDGYAQNGLFTLANQWRMALLFLPAALNATVMPILANLQGQNNMRSYRKVVLTNLALTGGGTAAMALIISAASPLIVWIYGDDFRGAEWTIVLLSASGVLMAINNVIGADMIGRGKMWLGVLFCVLVSSALLGFSAMLVPRYGATGLAAAFVGAYTLHTLWQGAYLYRTLSAEGSSAPTA